MESDIRKYTIILAVAILFAIFSFAFSDAFTTEIPESLEMCYQQPLVTDKLIEENCEAIPEIAPTCENGNLYINPYTCRYECDCYQQREAIDETNDAIRFWIGIVLGGIAITVGMLLNPKKKLNTWVGSGFILGGVITIFVATVGYWGDLHKIARPIIIALELGLVLWIAYKKFQ